MPVALQPTSAHAARREAYGRQNSEAAMRGFARGLLDVLDTHALPSAERQRLLTRAELLGLDRFEANLLIAAAQHRRARERMLTPSATRRNAPPLKREVLIAPKETIVPPRRNTLLPMAATAVLTQAALLAGALALWLS